MYSGGSHKSRFSEIPRVYHNQGALTALASTYGKHSSDINPCENPREFLMRFLDYIRDIPCIDTEKTLDRLVKEVKIQGNPIRRQTKKRVLKGGEVQLISDQQAIGILKDETFQHIYQKTMNPLEPKEIKS